MAIPTYDEFIWPLLKYLAEQPDGARTVDVYGALADRVGLTEDERAERLPSRRQPVHHNRIGWAHDRLKRAGLSMSPKRGTWRLTPAGTDFVAAHPSGPAPAEVAALARVDRDSRAQESEPLSAQPAADSLQQAETQSAGTKSPDERIELALNELRDSVASELLDLIAQSSPLFFESLVLDLLHAMGYGLDRTSLLRVGRSGDGGIDGIISLDRLGLEKVYVQAKRWQNNVGRPDVQGFYGALAGRRAKKGVFMTTSGFTREAAEFAETVSDAIVLVDGVRLAKLMIDHGVGVTRRMIAVPEVDNDYFEDA